MPGKKHVLVIDDEEMLLDLVGSSLEETAGYSVTAVADGESGLKAIRASPPDLVLLDLGLRGMSGWEVIDRLKDHPSPPPVIVMSGRGDHEPPELSGASRFVYGYLSKPFRMEQLTVACARVLSVVGSASAEAPFLPDRRGEARRSLVVPATLLSSTGTPVAVGELLNITTSGAELYLGASLQPGAQMTLSFEIPGGRGPFLVAVQIQWRRAGSLGLVFLRMPDDDSRRLAALLA